MDNPPQTNASPRAYIPDILSACRLAASVPTAAVLAGAVGGGLPILILLFAVVCATDVLDGRIARRYGCATRFGAVLDAVADGAVALSCAVAMACAGWTTVIYPLIVAAMLAKFFLTAGAKGRVVFDPYGRWFGILSMYVPLGVFILSEAGAPDPVMALVEVAMTAVAAASVLTFANAVYGQRKGIAKEV